MEMISNLDQLIERIKVAKKEKEAVSIGYYVVLFFNGNDCM